MKLLTTTSADIMQECRVMFGVKSVSKSIFKCRRNVLRVVFDFKMANIHGIKSNNEYIVSVLIAYRVLIVHKNTIGGEIWCSFLSTHAFLLGNGQTYATRGVPYFRVSHIFMSRIFHPCILVPHFHVPQFHVSHFPRPPSMQSWHYICSTARLLILGHRGLHDCGNDCRPIEQTFRPSRRYKFYSIAVSRPIGSILI